MGRPIRRQRVEGSCCNDCLQGIKQGGALVSENAEPAAEGATDAAAKQSKGVVGALHDLNKVCRAQFCI